MIYYYKGSFIYELNITVPKEKNICTYTCDNKLHVEYEDSCLAGFLKKKFSNLFKGTKEERKLCLKIVELCGGSKIWAICVINKSYNCELFEAEIEVGNCKNWKNNSTRPYGKRWDILKQDLGDGVMVRLCRGEHLGPAVHVGPTLWGQHER